MMSARRRLWPILTILTGIAILATPAPAQVIKLATLAPDGSAWDQALKVMGSAWRTATGGDVELRIYPGGVAGDESDIVRKMRIGQLHAAGLSIVGLAEVDESFEAFGIPLFFDDYEELIAVLHQVQPYFAAKLEEKGFVFLNWAPGGWARLFSARRASGLDELKSLKLFVTAGDDQRVQWWKANGFRPVPLAMTDIATGLQTGMIDAIASPPLVALSFQWFRQTPYMHELKLAPVVGATVISKRVWDRLPGDQHRALLQAAAEMEEQIFTAVEEQDERAIEAMKERGLTVVEDDSAESLGEQAQVFADSMSGSIVPADALAVLRRARDAYRDGAAGGGDTP